MNRNKDKSRRQRARHYRVRKRVTGTPEAPRLAVFRSLKHIYVQLIDDQPETGSRTLAAASTNDKELRGKISYGGNIDAAKAVGTAIANSATELGIKKIRFDRGGFKYQGRVKALADAAREAGLEF